MDVIRDRYTVYYNCSRVGLLLIDFPIPRQNKKIKGKSNEIARHHQSLLRGSYNSSSNSVAAHITHPPTNPPPVSRDNLSVFGHPILLLRLPSAELKQNQNTKIQNWSFARLFEDLRIPKKEKKKRPRQDITETVKVQQSEYIFIHTHEARRATGRRIKYTTRKSNIDSRYGVHVTYIYIFEQQKITKCDLARIIIDASPETIGKWSAIFNARQIQNGHKPFNISLSRFLYPFNFILRGD